MNMEEIYQSIEHIAKCEMYDAIEVKYLKSKFEELQQENNQLKDNWNKLKEYLNYKSERAVGEDEYVYDEIYNEMQELGQVSDSNEI